MLAYTQNKERHLFIVERKNEVPDTVCGIAALIEKIGADTFDAEELYQTGRTVTKDYEVTIVMKDNNVLSVVEFEEGEG